MERPFACSSLAPNVGTYADTVPEAVYWLIDASETGIGDAFYRNSLLILGSCSTMSAKSNF